MKRDNPRNRYERHFVEWVSDAPLATLKVIEEQAKSIVTENASPDLDFRYTVNPYRGCSHGCSYCYARPTHQQLGYGAGTDFERIIVAKLNAPELLAAELRKGRTRGEPILFSGVTDAYQGSEAKYELTRRCLEVCVEYGQPFSIVTKGTLVLRDIDVLAEAGSSAQVYLSIPFADAAVARKMEPWAPSPDKRFAALAELSAAGVATGISISPIVPGLNEDDVPRLVARAAASGARHAFATLLRLPGEVADVFSERLRDVLPLRAESILRAIRNERGGALNESGFGKRMEGVSPRWLATEQLFRLACTRHGLLPYRLAEGMPPAGRQLVQAGDARTREAAGGPGRRQLTLFGEDD